jgi:hypothetical protein
MKTCVFLLAILTAAACSGTPKTTTTEQPSGDDTGDVGGDDTAQTEPRPGRGEECDASGGCADGLECVEYYGIAGPSGPKFTSCETTCAKDPGECPEGTECQTIADGPGQVCR